MQVQKYANEEEWLAAREGRITGTRAGKLLSKRDGTPLTDYYQLIAENIAIPASGEMAMERGKRLEEEAVERFAKETGKKAKHTAFTLCMRDDNPNIAYSPDALIGKTEDVETKCRDSANHIKAIMTKTVPEEYRAQVLQGFIVNESLKKRHLVFYDPRCPKDFFYITIERKDVQHEIDECLELQRGVLAEIARIEKELTF